MSALDDLATSWTRAADGAAGHTYREALEDAGREAEAEAVYRALIAAGYLVGYTDLAWLLRTRGELEEAERVLAEYLSIDAEPDEVTALWSGMLGHWRWDRLRDVEAEELLRKGMEVLPEARADLARLLVATGRCEEAESTLRVGVANSEVESFLPLGNLLSDGGRVAEAEDLYRQGFALGDAHSAYNLSRDLDRAGRTAEAEEWLRRAAGAGDATARSWLEQSSE
jgi:tetratricopeptide (TPR) repeat protein